MKQIIDHVDLEKIQFILRHSIPYSKFMELEPNLVVVNELESMMIKISYDLFKEREFTINEEKITIFTPATWWDHLKKTLNEKFGWNLRFKMAEQNYNCLIHHYIVYTDVESKINHPRIPIYGNQKSFL